MRKKIVSRWKAKTSKTVKFLQILLAAIGVASAYYSALPEEWKIQIPVLMIKVAGITGFLTALALQFTQRKTKTT